MNLIMKRTIIAATLIATALLLVSCGGKGKKAKLADGKIDAVEAAKDLMDKAPEDRNTKEAAIYWLKKSNGIDYSAIAPSWELDESRTYTFTGDESSVRLNFSRRKESTPSRITSPTSARSSLRPPQSPSAARMSSASLPPRQRKTQ